MPRQPGFPERKRHIRPIDFDSSYEPAVTISLLALDANLLSEDELGRELLRSLGEIRAVLWTVDSVKTNSCLLAAIVDGDRIAVVDAYNFGVERLR